MEEDKFEKFWERAWSTLFHILGMTAILGGVVLFVWGVFQPESEFSPRRRGEAQTSFNKTLLSGTPCATTNDEKINLDRCLIFGLRPGMLVQESLALINSSGYFQKREALSVCESKDKCSSYASFIRDGFYLRNDFTKDDQGTERLTEITLSFDGRAHPYFDPMVLKASFIKLIGTSGLALGNHTLWTSREGSSIDVYIYESALWVIFRSSSQK